jgi:hypothetical protein
LLSKCKLYKKVSRANRVSTDAMVEGFVLEKASYAMIASI